MSPLPPRATLFPYTTLFRSYAEPSEPTEHHGCASALVMSSSVWCAYTAGTEPPCSRRTSNSSSSASGAGSFPRSEEHTSELQSQSNLVCRLLLEKKKKNTLI